MMTMIGNQRYLKLGLISLMGMKMLRLVGQTVTLGLYPSGMCYVDAVAIRRFTRFNLY